MEIGVIIIIVGIITNIIGWTKTLIVFFDWVKNRNKEKYDSAMRSIGYDTQYMFGTYYILKNKLTLLHDYFDGKLPLKDLQTQFSSGHLAYTSKIQVNFYCFKTATSAFKIFFMPWTYGFRLKNRLNKIYLLMLGTFNCVNGKSEEANEICTLCEESLDLIEKIISKYQLPENDKV